MLRLLAALGLVLLGPFVAPLPVLGDTENCVSHIEVDNYENGLTRTQVWNRFDIYGDAVGDTVDGDGYRAVYMPTCWAPDTRKVVIAYDYASGGSIWLDIRDI